MRQSTTGVKKIAKNTGVVYLRMVLLIIIAFYTSRILLKTLGIVDFGVYSVVGSISSTFIAIKSLFSESVQRFLNVSKGKNPDDYSEQISIFNISLIIHLVLVVVFVLIVETIGLWLLQNKLDIPTGRYEAACFVFHMTVLATSISILSIPYDAVIVANEKMGFYATISVFDALLRLCFVFVLPIIGIDYLLSYSFLLVFIPATTLLIQLLYVRRFSECKYNLRFNKVLFKEIFTLSGWNFFGNISFSLIHEGINLFLNIFGGVVMNTARAIAYQVKAVTSQLTANTMLAVRPSIIQRSSSLEKKEFYETIITLSRISFFLMLVPTATLIVYTPQLLDIWLGTVPEKATLFTRIVLIGIVFRSLHDPLNIMYMSLGKIKRMMIVESLVMLCFLAIVYSVLKMKAPIWSPFVVLSVMELVIIMLISFNARCELEFPFNKYLRRVIYPMILMMIVSSIILYSLGCFLKADSMFLTILGAILSAIIEICICFIFMEEKEQNLLKRLIKSKND
ncbi:polysaccharide biosynthesis protein [Prevotella communis]|uniref:lipopolysaccharide biosynthesis protein n=1 Tax=Prevotella communis TaxID=2913614 RepID=UPI001EDBD875|nr:polysaccharide biosynthesis protein [Prevotella communis]UKK59608.1 polysaccharide biosynthesis protein [Prevotella communis]